MARRSQMEILMDILTAVANGKQKPTHIMYRANLAWTRLQRQLDFLIKQDMLTSTEVDGGMIYKITRRGKEVLEYFKKIESELYYKKRGLPTEVYIHYK